MQAEKPIRRSRIHCLSTCSLQNGGLSALFLVLLITAATRADQNLYPLEPPDTSSPRATLESFIDAMDKTYELARKKGRTRMTDSEQEILASQPLRCLDLSELPDFARTDAGRHAAVCLKEVLDRIPLPRSDEIPHKTADGDPESEEKMTSRWRVPHTDITISKVEQGLRAGEYLFSPYTVAHATEFYDRVKHLPYKPGASEGFYKWYLTEPGSDFLARLVQQLPGWMHKRVYGQAIWQWVGLVLTVIVGLLVMLLAFWLGRVRALPHRQTNFFRYWLFFVFPLAALLVPQAVKNFVGDQLVVSGKTLATVDFCADVVFLLTLVMVIMAMANRIAAAIISSPRIQPKGIDAQFIRLVFRVAGMVTAVMIFIEGGKYLGISLSTVLAGAGVGGLAVALGAQDTLKNLFGSMMIVLDKPYRVGERIVFKGYDGVVEEIGLRSTRLRLLTGHQVTIPNDEMGRCDIENIGRRPHIRRIADLAIPLDTPTEKIEQALRIVRDLLQDHEGMEEAFPPRAHFNEYNRDSLNLRIIYWYHPPNYWDFMAFSERLNLRIKRQLEAAGILFALPTTTTHLAASENTSVVINPARVAESDAANEE